MHPTIRKGRVGRVCTRQINFPFKERTMPDPPKEAKEAHDYIVRHSIPDPAGLRVERKWVNPGNFPAPPKFCRLHSHARVFSTCERDDLFLLPENRRLQCFYFPRLPKTQRKRVCETTTRNRGASIFAKEDMWGAWKPDTQLPDTKEQIIIERQYRTVDKLHAEWFYKKHEQAIETLRARHKKGESNYRSWQPPQPPPKPKKQLKTRKDLDLGAVKSLRHWKPNLDELLARGYLFLSDRCCSA